MTKSTSTTRSAFGQIRTVTRTFSLAAALLLTASAANGQCDPAWEPVGSGADDWVLALTPFDDGSGPALYAGGDFSTMGGVSAHWVAKWSGVNWLAVGSGLSGSVRSLAVFDDGHGEALYAAPEEFVGNSVVEKWDGAQWTRIGRNIFGPVLGMQAHDDGSGPSLYVVGMFDMKSSTVVNNIVEWDGSAWAGVSTGLTDGVNTSADGIAVFDDGSGDALYVGGDFTRAGSTPANNIARWDGTEWSALGSGLQGGGRVVRTLTVADLGNGPKLYAGGNFLLAGSVAATNIAVWDGAAWSAMGAGLNGDVEAITVFDDGSGPAMYVAGRFTSSGGVYVGRIARWDGEKWHPASQGVSGAVWALSVFDDGLESISLYEGGGFAGGGGASSNVAKLRVQTPLVTSHPADQSALAGDPTSFSFDAISTPGPYSIRWRKDGQPLFDQPQRLTGTTTTKLMISSVEITDVGLYDAVLTNVCGNTTTRAAQLRVTFKPCWADCDQSTGPRVLDIFDFLCFQTAFVKFDPYADCDGNNILEIFDFLCFQDAFVSGCP